jgi:O-antigen ligase
MIGVGLIVSFARSAQLGTLAAAVFLVLTLPGRWRRVGVGALVAVVIVALLIPAVRLRALEAFTDEKEVTRLNLWRSSVAGIADRPLRGWGPGNFGAMLDEHEVDGYYEVRAHTHNDYLMHAINAGLPGLLAALWLIWATVRHLHAGWRRGGAGSWIPLAGVACQVAIMTAGVLQVYQTDDEPEMLLYYLIGLGLAQLATSRREDAPGA